MNKLETIQNYLEAIYILSLNKEKIRAIDIASYLGYSRPTVSIALKDLQNDQYIKVDQNIITLLPKGEKEAIKMYERHELVAEILIKLGVNKDTAYEDSCKIEHIISDETFEAIKNYYLKK